MSLVWTAWRHPLGSGSGRQAVLPRRACLRPSMPCRSMNINARALIVLGSEDVALEFEAAAVAETRHSGK